MRRLIALPVLALALAACGDDNKPSAQQNESKAQQSGYSRLAAAQPAHTMAYSPTRDTINFWIDTWSAPGKLSYVYLQAANGQLVGYYIFKGLPVNYCASLTPTYRWEDIPKDGDTLSATVPAPSIDGVYYSGGQCMTFYGKDAVSGSYIEYTVGAGQNVLLYDRPMPRQTVEPLGFATVDTVKS